MKRFLAVLLLLPTLAFAETPPTNAPPTVPSGGAAAPHVCGQKFYPPEAVRLGQEGFAVIAFRISPQGDPHDIYVVKSSGSIVLDYASTVCPLGWKYKPAMQNGNPIDVPWRAKITWELNDSGTATEGPVAIGAPHVCTAASTPNKKLSPTVLSFLISSTGNVTSLNLLQTSGDAALDQYGLTCVSTWQFQPAKAGNQAVTAESFATIDWTAPQPSTH